MKHPVFSATSLLVLSAFLALGEPASAHGSVDRTEEGRLEVLVKDAELAFFGQVVDVVYDIEKTGGETGDEKSADPAELPLTYVTYQVEKVLLGEAADEKLTLRFVGGPDGRGRFLTVSGVPRFQPKDQDVVFVRGNGAEGCPLVTCQNGRFRVLRGGVYNGFGVAVQAIVDQGVIARGQRPKEFRRFAYPTPSFDVVIRNPEARAMLERRGLSVEEARRLYNEQAPREIVVTSEIVIRPEPGERESDSQPNDPGAIRETEEPLQEAPIAVEEFMEHVQKLAQDSRRDRKPVESLRPGSVPLPSLTLSAPSPNPPRVNREDEEGSMRENDGNPVMPKE